MRPPFAAVIGCPVGHSLSPRIFRIFAKDLGRKLHYRAVEVPPDRLPAALDSGKSAGLPWLGWNVTLPHKVAVMEFLDEIDAPAREAGAVNVVRFRPGKAFGHNTDVAGFLAPLKALGFDAGGKRVVVLGAGGAARAVGVALRSATVEELVFLGRTPEKAEDVAARVGGRGAALSDESELRSIAAADLVVNATSAGMDGKGCALPGAAALKPGALAYDLVYRPKETPFLARAKAAGARSLGGMGMLIAQAAATWALWFDEDVPEATLRRAESELGGLP